VAKRECDVQVLWSHINADREGFVTADDNFHATLKNPGLIALGAKRIEHPADAAALVCE
jgi:hypothetical protein